MSRLRLLALLAGIVLATRTYGQASRTGLIVGQVVDATTGKPVPDVVVTLTTPFASSNLPTTPRGRVMTDAEGRFFFADLPPTPTGTTAAGGYAINASKPGYVDSFYGKRRPGTGGLVYFDLADGERRNDAKILMWKYAAIGGTVVDEAGDPVVGVAVRAYSRSYTTGGPRTTGVPVGSGQPGTTDDRGVYRIFTLVPGDYVVVVPSTLATFPAAVVGSGTFGMSTALTNEMFAVSAELSPLGGPKNQQIGDHVLLTQNQTAIPPAPVEGRPLNVYQTLFHPSAVSAAEAATITLKAGEERSNIDVRLRPVRAVRVSGTLTGPEGPVGLTALRLVPASAGDYASESGFSAVTALADDRGRFTFLGVPAGQYVLRMNKRSTLPPSESFPKAVDPSVLWGAEPVTVGDTDVRDLVVSARPLIRVAGRFEFEGTSPPPTRQLEGLVLRLAPAGSGAVATTTQLDADGAFVVGVPGGTYSLRPQPPSGWYVKSVSLGARDISDSPLDIRADDLPALVVRCTNAPSQLAGVVRTAQGAPDANATTLVFPVDRQLWSGAGPLMRLRSARTSRTGAYLLADMPPGEYYVVAIDDGDGENWQESASLDTLRRGAVRVTIAAGENRTLDLRRR